MDETGGNKEEINKGKGIDNMKKKRLAAWCISFSMIFSQMAVSAQTFDLAEPTVIEEVGSETIAESENMTESESMTEVMPEIETESESMTEVMTETEIESESMTEAMTEIETESESMTEAMTEIETESERMTEAMTETETESERMTEEMTETETESEAMTEKVTEPDPEAEGKKELLKDKLKEKATQEDVIPNDASGIPDPAFYKLLLAKVGKEETEKLTTTDAESITSLDIMWLNYSSQIQSMEGIQYLKNLEYFDYSNDEWFDEPPVQRVTHLNLSGLANLREVRCEHSSIMSLNIDMCPQLTVLNCDGSYISSLNLSGCPNLTQLNCSNTDISELDVTGCPNLTELDCWHTNISELNLGNCPNLTRLDCSDTSISTLDLSGCSGLTDLSCYETNVTTLDVSGCSNLKKLSCGGRDHLNVIGIKNCQNLVNFEYANVTGSSIDLSGMTSLEYVQCYRTSLDVLNLSGCTSLKKLTCIYGQFGELDLSGCTSLNMIEVREDWLEADTKPRIGILNASGCENLEEIEAYITSSIDVQGCANLRNLYVHGGGITQINVEDCVNLQNLSCSRNNLSELDLSGCVNLQELSCEKNNLVSLILPDTKTLREIDCSSNQLKNLDLTGNTALSTLSCSHNQMTSLLLPAGNSLEEIDCSYNQLTDLNIKNRTKLKNVNCAYNMLDTLNLSGGSRIEKIDANNNQLTQIDLTGCSGLESLEVSYNYLSEVPKTTATKLYYKYNPIDKKGYTPEIDSIFVVNGNSLKLTWTNKKGNSNQYLLMRKEGKNGIWKEYVRDIKSEYNSDYYSYIDKKVKPGVEYFYALKLYTDDERGIYYEQGVNKETASAKIELEELKIPSLVSAVQVGSQKVKVTWKSVPKATGYYVYRKYKGGAWRRVGEVTGNTKTSFVDTGMNRDTFYYTVRAVRKINGSVQLSSYNKNVSCKVTVWTPVLKSAKSVNYHSIQIKWQKEPLASKYRVYRKTDRTGWQRLATISGTEYTDTSALTGVMYSYTVRAENGSDLSDYDKKGISCKAMMPAPILKSAVSVSNGVKISWGRISGAEGYFVYRKLPGQTWSRIKQISSPSTLSYTDTGAVKGKKYLYTVRGYRKVNGKTVYSPYDTAGISGIRK